MAFPQFEITLFKPSYFLTKASPYLFLIISAIDFTVGNQILSDIITNRYGEAFVKKIWRIKKCDFKLRKCHLDLRFLLDCKKNSVIPKFFRFKLANRHLDNSHVYRKCQLRLLQEEIKSKRKRINTLENDTQRVKKELQRTFSVLDFSYICSLFLLLMISPFYTMTIYIIKNCKIS